MAAYTGIQVLWWSKEVVDAQARRSAAPSMTSEKVF